MLPRFWFHGYVVTFGHEVSDSAAWARPPGKSSAQHPQAERGKDSTLDWLLPQHVSSASDYKQAWE